MHIPLYQSHPRVTKILLGASAVSVAALLVFISLRMTPVVSDHEAQRLSHKKVYLAGPILPDNILFPLLRIPELVRLQTLDPEKAILFRLELSHQRLEDARALIEKGNEVLALVSLQKSHAYALEASQQAVTLQVSPQLSQTVAAALSVHMSEINEVRQHFTQQDATSVGQMNAQAEVFLSQLDAQQS